MLACRPPEAAAEPKPAFAVVSVNDTYRIEGLPEAGQGGFARVRSFRAQTEYALPTLVLHAGDLLSPSLLSSAYAGEQMIDVLNGLDGDAAAFDPRLFVTFGNHEFDRSRLEDAAKLDARLDASQFTWLSANVRFATGPDGAPLVASEHLAPRALVDLGGVPVGVFGVTTPAKGAAFVAGIDDPVETARRETKALRDAGTAFVIALTHLPLARDVALLEALPAPEGPDLVVGGHEHVGTITDVGGRLVVKGDADAVTAVRTLVRRDGDRFVAAAEAVPMANWPPDPVLQGTIDGWLARHQREFCAKKGLAEGCLDAPAGYAAVPLSAEELRIRRFETNVGDWLADLARGAYPDQGVQVALINAGSIRLNRDLPAGALTRRHVEELLPYATTLKVVDVPGKVLRDEVLAHAIHDWSGNGWFLQVSGLGFTHDVATGAVRDVWLQDGAARRPIRDDETIRAVTTDFLMDPSLGNRDGYTMIDVAWGRGGDVALKDLVLRALADAGAAGIAPAADGRICTSTEGPCP